MKTEFLQMRACMQPADDCQPELRLTVYPPEEGKDGGEGRDGFVVLKIESADGQKGFDLFLHANHVPFLHALADKCFEAARELDCMAEPVETV